MDELIKKLQEKAKACGDSTKEDRARKGAYIDCIVELKALRKHAVVGRSEQCCSPTDGFYLGMTCPTCNKPFRMVHAK
jgi:hypothetical protein